MGRHSIAGAGVGESLIHLGRLASSTVALIRAAQRLDGSVVKGYERAQFVELWDTYLPQLSSVDFTAE